MCTKHGPPVHGLPLWTPLLKMNFTSWAEYDMNNNVGRAGYYPPKANFALSLYYQAYELLILYTCSNFLEFHTWIRYSLVKDEQYMW